MDMHADSSASNSSSATQYVYDRLREQATAILVATGLVAPETVTLATPKPNIPADLSFPVFAAAKAAGETNPNAFAQRIACHCSG